MSFSSLYWQLMVAHGHGMVVSDVFPDMALGRPMPKVVRKWVATALMPVPQVGNILFCQLTQDAIHEISLVASFFCTIHELEHEPFFWKINTDCSKFSIFSMWHSMLFEVATQSQEIWFWCLVFLWQGTTQVRQPKIQPCLTRIKSSFMVEFQNSSISRKVLGVQFFDHPYLKMPYQVHPNGQVLIASSPTSRCLALARRWAGAMDRFVQKMGWRQLPCITSINMNHY